MYIDSVFQQPEGAKLGKTERLTFAKQVLFFIFLFVVVVSVTYGFNPTNDALKQMFELVKVGVLPLITLVICFYFFSSRIVAEISFIYEA